MGTLLVSMVAGCKFYTGCPGVDGNGNPPASTGGASGGQGPSNGGSGASAAAGAGGSYPIPDGSWVSVTSNLAGLESECGNLSFVSAKPDEDVLLAGVALLGIWASRDGGGSWDPIGQGKDSDAILNRTSAFVFDPDVPERYWESGIYHGPGVYLTEDNGDTFKQLGDVTFSDLVSIDFTDPDRQTLVAGEHEASRALNRSTDGGKTWSSIGSGLPDATNCTYPLVIDSQVYLVGCGGYGGGPAGVYRTTNGGKTWRVASTAGGAGAPLLASDGTIYWASPFGGGLARSDDGGETFKTVGTGVLSNLHPIELPDRSIAAMGHDGGPVMLSSDRGETWHAVTTRLKNIAVLTYSDQQRAFFSSYFTCGNGALPVPDDAIQRYDFDYESN